MRQGRVGRRGGMAGCLVIGLLAAGPAAAQQPSPMPGMAAMPHGADGGALMKAMENMDKAMAAAPQTGDIDHDFAAMMIPHHQGAIDMAKAELAAGKDPFLRRLARQIVTSQQREIRDMRRWQKRHPAHTE